MAGLTLDNGPSLAAGRSLPDAFILVPGLLVIGIVAGFFVREQAEVAPAYSNEPTQSPESTQAPTLGGSPDTDRLDLLEIRIADLQARVEFMETDRFTVTEAPAVAGSSDENTRRDQVLLLFENSSALATEATTVTSNLISAGIDSFTAEEIVRKQSEAALARLELRDNAIREGYMRTQRYREELQALNSQDPSIRDEVGDEYFDRYLFASGQNNRIGVTSVISGSAAEAAGMEEGDVILRYGERLLFDFRELQSATVEGNRDELVDVTVLRSGLEVVVTLPRGPLGVRLFPTRIDPDNS